MRGAMYRAYVLLAQARTTLRQENAMSWSAKQYVAFEDERTRPARDLLAAIPPWTRVRPSTSVVAPATRPIAGERFTSATVRGVDSSTDMIEAARKRLPQVHSTPSIWPLERNGPFDVIFANAVLQWLPDHANLLPALASKLSTAGSLAIQMPDTSTSRPIA